MTRAAFSVALFLIFLLSGTIPVGAQTGENVGQAWVTQNLTSMPLAFTENMGQWDERALFRADAGGATMWITTEGVYYQFTRRVPSSKTHFGWADHVLSVEELL